MYAFPIILPKIAYSESAGQVRFSCYSPAIFFIKWGRTWSFIDESQSTDGALYIYECAAEPTVSDQKGNAVIRFNAITSSGTAIDIPAGAPICQVTSA